MSTKFQSATDPRLRLKLHVPCLYLSASNSDPNRMLSLTVRLRTQGDCAAYAMPPSRGRLNHESGPDGMKCSSPSNANRIEVFPEPVGPSTRLSTPGLKNKSPLNRRRNLRVDGVDGAESDGESAERSQEKTALWNPIALMSAEGGTNCARRPPSP